jgi:hypothetical protein
LGCRLEDLAPFVPLGGLDTHGIAVGWPAMRGFRVVACTATTMSMSDGLVAAMTLVVGLYSGVYEGLRVGLPLL